MPRSGDFQSMRKHLKGLSDQELKERFWELTDDIIEPLIELAAKNTSPSIERSVLLRMGFSSLDASSIVSWAVRHGLIGKGAGHLVLAYSQDKHIDYIEAGRELSQGIGWDKVRALFGGGA